MLIKNVTFGLGSFIFVNVLKKNLFKYDGVNLNQGYAW